MRLSVATIGSKVSEWIYRSSGCLFQMTPYHPVPSRLFGSNSVQHLRTIYIAFPKVIEAFGNLRSYTKTPRGPKASNCQLGLVLSEDHNSPRFVVTSPLCLANPGCTSMRALVSVFAETRYEAKETRSLLLERVNAETDTISFPKTANSVGRKAPSEAKSRRNVFQRCLAGEDGASGKGLILLPRRLVKLSVDEAPEGGRFVVHRALTSLKRHDDRISHADSNKSYCSRMIN